MIFPANFTTLSLNVPIKEDSITDGNETFCVTIIPDSLPYDVIIDGNHTTTVTIIDSKYPLQYT